MKTLSTTYDYSKLRGRIREKFKTQAAFAATIGLSSTSLSAKLSNRSQWTHDEMAITAELLDFGIHQICEYFFKT